MSYHHLGQLPDFASTQLFVQGVTPYTQQLSPPGIDYSPYGWGPDFNIGMPMNYTHHMGYERTPILGAPRYYPKPRIPGARRNTGTYYDTLSGVLAVL